MIISALSKCVVSADEPNYASLEATVQGEQVPGKIRPCFIHLTSRSAWSRGGLQIGSSPSPWPLFTHLQGETVWKRGRGGSMRAMINAGAARGVEDLACGAAGRDAASIA